MPVEIRQRTAQFSAVEIAGVHKGFPTRAALVRALAEQPQQSGGIAVEDCVVQPQIEFVQLIAARMKLHHSPVADDQTAFKGAEVDQGDPFGIGVRVAFGGQVRFGIAVAAPRNPPEIQRHPISPVRRNRIDGAFIPADDAFADLKNPGDRLLLLRVEIVVDEAVRPPRQEKFHAALLVTPAPGAGQRLVTAFAVEQADFGGLAGKRQPFALRRLQRQVAAAVAVPRVAVVVAEEVVAVVRRDLLPFVFGMDAHVLFSLLIDRG